MCGAALRARGISGGMRVAIISENRHEWVVADLAIMLIGAISVPLFTSQTGDDYSYLLTQSGARAAICSTPKIAYQVEPAAQASPNCLFMVVMRPGKNIPFLSSFATVTWKDFLEEGRQAPAVTPEDRHHISETDVACIIYNSGATQKPKGVMLTHKSIIANLKGIHDWIARCCRWVRSGYYRFCPCRTRMSILSDYIIQCTYKQRYITYLAQSC